jgi:hypothetical protein
MNEEDTIQEAPKDPLIEAIRERVNAYISGAPGYEGMSLRELSRRVGMSASGVTKFAVGSMPYTGTRRKLIRWYKTLAPATRDEQKRDGLAMLLADVPSAQRAEAERQVLALVAGFESPDAARAAKPRRGRPPGRRGGAKG